MKSKCVCTDNATNEACPVCIAGEPDIQINIRIDEWHDNGIVSSSYMEVNHLEREDDGSITAVVLAK